jgi:hypothetical protein
MEPPMQLKAVTLALSNAGVSGLETVSVLLSLMRRRTLKRMNTCVLGKRPQQDDEVQASFFQHPEVSI